MAGALTIRELLTRYSFQTDTKPIKVLDNAVASLKKRVANLDAKIIGAFKTIAKVSIAGATGFAVAAVKMASDAEESESKFEAVFKELSGTTRAWSETVAEQMGRSGYKIREFASSLQDTFVPLGLSRDTAAQLSQNLTELAMDVASFQNKAEPDVINAFASALVGNHEAVRSLGISMTQADIDTKIKQLRKSMAGFTSMGKEQQKVFARYQLILERTGDAHGDAVTTSGGFANQMRRLKAKVSDLTIEIGKHLLPHVKVWVEKASEWIDNNKELIKQNVTAAVKALVEAVKVLAKVVYFLAQHWKAVLAVVGAFVAGRIIFGVYRLAKGLMSVVGALRSVTGAAGAAAGGLGSTTQAATGATGALGGLVAKLGAVAMAFKVGWDIGTAFDEWSGASKQWANIMSEPQRQLSKAKAIIYENQEAYKRLNEQAAAFAKMAASGVKSVVVEGGKSMDLTKENVQARLAKLASELRIPQQVQANLLPKLVQNIAPGPGGEMPPAQGGKGGQQITVQNHVTVPPGTPESQAKRVADATGAATTRAMRSAQEDIRR